MLIACAQSGCLGGGKVEIKTYPVAGTVLYKGEPLAGATVSFWGPNSARAAAGTTDAGGEFTLSAQAGENRILVTKSADETPASPGRVALQDPATLAVAAEAARRNVKKASAKGLVPARYSVLTDSPLKENVSVSDVNQFELKLVD
jgi:hypothetical protein